jgi:hypothetical protein
VQRSPSNVPVFAVYPPPGQKADPTLQRFLKMPFRKATLALAPFLVASCARAPSFDILGSFFPAWLVCVVAAILLTVLVWWLQIRLHVEVTLPVLVYPSLTALFASALWLVFFH